MSRIAYVNGRYVEHRRAAVNVEDRGYQFGDGIYEVVHVYGGRLIDADRHLDRLDRSSEIMTLPLREARELFEKQYLEAQLLRFGGNISRTANFVGMERSALHRKLKFLGVHAEDRTPVAAPAPAASANL